MARTKVEVLTDADDEHARRILLRFRILVNWLPPVRPGDASLPDQRPVSVSSANTTICQPTAKP